MCELFAMSSRVPATVTFSLEEFARHGRLEELWLRDEAVPGLDDRLAILSAFASVIRRLGPANFIYTDGDVIFAHGHRRTQLGGEIVAMASGEILRRVEPSRVAVDAG